MDYKIVYLKHLQIALNYISVFATKKFYSGEQVALSCKTDFPVLVF